jgi:hypothetical protein
MEDNKAPPSLRELVLLEDYQRANSHVFPSLESVRWYLKQRRARLIESGALLFINGRNWVNPAAFDRCAVESGQRDARDRHAD